MEKQKKKVLNFEKFSFQNLKSKFHPTRRSVLITVIVFVFFISELTILWAIAEAKVAFNPNVFYYGAAAKKTRKQRSLKPPPPAAKASKIEAPQATDSLVIKKLSVNAVVEPVGVLANGEMGTSKSLYNVAWYKDGTVPGERGSAVLAGHSGAPGELGIFKNIDQLNNGDEIDYRFKDGRLIKYIIYKKATYPVNDMPLKDIFNKGDGKYLNLISCYGNWDYASSRFDKRIVVYAKAD